MPYPFNNVTTADAYDDARSVVFPSPKAAFTLNIANAAIYYQLARPGNRSGDYVWDQNEYYLLPSFTSFSDPSVEIPGATAFAGVRVRSAAVGIAAAVTVI